MSKIKIEEIEKILKNDGWKLISTEYKNLKEELIFECDEGHTVYSNWDKIRKNRVCPICSNNKLKNQSNIILEKKKDTYRILALDQASKITGYAILDNGKLIKSGFFKTDLDNEIARDHQIKMWLISIINNLKPDIVGLEDIQLQKFKNQEIGVTTYKILAHLQGILMEALYELKIPYVIVSPATWRSACDVKGKTRVDRKRAMQIKTKEWFDITVSDDEADAIGIGKYLSKNYHIPKIESWE